MWWCNWLLGYLGDDERRRPDNLGLLFGFEALEKRLLMAAYEVWPGAANEQKASYLLHKVSRKTPVLVCTECGLSVECPNKMQASEILAAIARGGLIRGMRYRQEAMPLASNIGVAQ
jgi:hypothetical protein